MSAAPDIILTVAIAELPQPPHMIIYRTPDGHAHRAEGNLYEGVAIPAGATIEDVAFLTPPGEQPPITLLLDGVPLADDGDDVGNSNI